MLNINKFLDNLESYQEIGANALNIEHNFSIGGISMMQAVLGVATLGIAALTIGLVVLIVSMAALVLKVIKEI